MCFPLFLPLACVALVVGVHGSVSQTIGSQALEVLPCVLCTTQAKKKCVIVRADDVCLKRVARLQGTVAPSTRTYHPQPLLSALLFEQGCSPAMRLLQERECACVNGVCAHLLRFRASLLCCAQGSKSDMELCER